MPFARRILGLASGDLELRRLIPFESTPDTEKFSHLAIAGRSGRTVAQMATPRALARETETQLPVSLAVQAVARLQEEGKQAFAKKDYRGAIDAWSEAITQARGIPCPAPKRLEASRVAQLYANRCQAHLTLGDDARALADAESACDAAPGWPKAYYRLGTVLAKLGRLSRAHAVFSQGLKLDSSNVEMRKMLDNAAEQLGQVQEDSEINAASSPTPPPPLTSEAEGANPTDAAASNSNQMCANEAADSTEMSAVPVAAAASTGTSQLSVYGPCLKDGSPVIAMSEPIPSPLQGEIVCGPPPKPSAPESASSLRMPCWGCGAQQPSAPAKPFQTCARCREEGLQPMPFCGRECLKANWPRHKAWHAEQK